MNKSVFSDMQRIWDLYSPKSHINLIVCGSIYSMMTKIFKDKKEPLYNRQSRFMTVRPFTPTVLKDILSEYNPGYTAEDLLALYAFTGGVAKYVQLLVDAEATTKTAMLDQIIKADSIFLGEGKAILIEEFGKDYGIYFPYCRPLHEENIPFGNRERGRQGNRRLSYQAGERIRNHIEETTVVREEFRQECPVYH